MRDQLSPWRAMKLCALTVLLAIVGNLVMGIITGSSNSLAFSMMNVLTFGGLPMCFYFVAESLANLQRENLELRERLDEMMKEQA